MRRGSAALALVLLAVPVRAQEIHRTENGDTLGNLATRYYGDPSLADLIAAHNDLTRGLQPGVELRLPAASSHTVERGESWDDLAARYWSDAALGSALARWLGSAKDSEPLVGSTLEVPALFTYRLKPGETLVGLARRFHRDISRAELLAELNGVKDPRHLHAGRKLRIPVAAKLRSHDAVAPEPRLASGIVPRVIPALDDRMTASTASRDVLSAPPPNRPELAPDLMGAVNAYLDGSFETALSQLEAQRAHVLAAGSDDERKLLLRYLIFSYVAFDRDDAACDAYAALRELERPPRLSPELVSPKIRDALATCD